MDGLEKEIKSLLPVSDFSRRGFMMTSLISGFTMAITRVEAQTITTDATGLEAGEVKIKVPDGEIPAYRSMPASGGPFPTVLVIQEIFGVHEHIKDVTRRFAKLGYMAVAPELYARQAKFEELQTMEGARAGAAKVPDGQVMSDLDATVAYMKASGKGNTDKLGITGFCYGGRIVWLYSAHSSQVKAGVAWYGGITGPTSELRPKHPLDVAKDMKAPVLGLYGGQDQGIPVADLDKMKEALKAAGKTNCDFVVYPDAPHAFHADYRPSYRKEAAEDGWKRLQEWFKKNGVA
jgi:carboxymethylenebutenolidase